MLGYHGFEELPCGRERRVWPARRDPRLREDLVAHTRGANELRTTGFDRAEQGAHRLALGALREGSISAHALRSISRGAPACDTKSRWRSALKSSASSANSVPLRQRRTSSVSEESATRNVARERRMRVAQPDQLAELRDDGPAQRGEQLVVAVVMPIDVAADACAAEQLEIVFAREQADVIDLRYAGHEELQSRARAGSRDRRARARRRRCSSPGRDRGSMPPRRSRAGSRRRCSRESISTSRSSSRGGTRPGSVGIAALRADVDDADAVVRVEHRQRIARANARASP